MAYRIDYAMGTAQKIELVKPRQKKSAKYLFLIVMLIGLLLGRLLLQEVLLPAENSPTVEAFAEFYSAVYEGEDIWESIETYCRTVLTDAKYGG